MIPIYKAVIIDDENSSRRILEVYLRDLCPDFETEASFGSGKEALAWLEQNQADVVLTDVRMTEMSGIDVARYIWEKKWNCKVVIVSAYPEFEYVQKAMDYDVVCYLLKAVGKKDFLEAMEKVRISLKKQEKQTFLDKKLDYTIFFCDAFGGVFGTEKEAEDAYALLESKVSFQEAACELVEFEIEQYSAFLDTRWKYGAGTFEDSMETMLSLLYKASFVILVKAVSGKFHFVIFHGCNADPVLKEDITYQMYDLFGLHTVWIRQTKFQLPELAGNKDFGLFNQREREQIEVSRQTEKAKNMREEVIKKVKNYIGEHFGEKLSRNEIADRFFLNEDYLGRIFKMETGQTILEYLYETRMNYAVRLLEQGKSVEQICAEVGYTEERNFRRSFRKYTGYSVTEYRKYGGKK